MQSLGSYKHSNKFGYLLLEYSYYYLAMHSINKMEEILGYAKTYDLESFKETFNNAFYDYDKNLSSYQSHKSPVYVLLRFH